MNHVTLWNREAFLRIKPRREYPLFNEQVTMARLADAIEAGGGPSIICERATVPWGAAGLLPLGLHIAEAWAVTSRQMLRHVAFFTKACQDGLFHCASVHGYTMVRAQVRQAWNPAVVWLEDMGFSKVGVELNEHQIPMVQMVWRYHV